MHSIKSISWLFLSNTLKVVIGIIFLPYLARSLSVLDYAGYGQSLMIYEIIRALSNLGLSAILIPFLSNPQQNEKNAYIISNLILLAFLSLLGALVTLFFNNEIALLVAGNTNINGFICILSVALMSDNISQSLEQVLIYYKKIKHIALLNGLITVLKISLTYISISVIGNIELAFYSIVICSITKCLILLFLIPKEIFKGKFSKSKILHQLKIGVPVGISYMVGLLFTQVDAIMVSKMLGTNHYATLRSGAIEIPLISSLYSSVSAISLVKVSQLMESGNSGQILVLKNKIIKNLSFIIFPIVILSFFYSKDIIVFLLSEKYSSSYIVFALYTAVVLFRVNDYQEVIVSAKKTHYILINAMIILSINFALNYFLINEFGVNGAALSTLISNIIGFTFMTFFNLKILKASVFDYYPVKYIFLAAIVPTAFGIFSKFLSVTYDLSIIINLFTIAVGVILSYLFFLKLKVIDKNIINILPIPNMLKKMI